MPSGHGADHIDLSSCDDCGDLCSGAAFLGDDGSIYFYDYRQNNLKVLAPSKAPGVTVIPGPDVSARNAQPTDGAVSADGTIYLLADRGALTERYRIYVRVPSDTSWRTADPLDDATIGWTSVAGKRAMARGVARIRVSPIGQVEVYDFDRRRSPAVVVGDRLGILAARDRVVLPLGAVGRLGHVVRRERGTTVVVSGGQTRTLGAPGVFLGTDAKDCIYLCAPSGTDGVDLLQRFSPDGQLLAQAAVPARPLAALLRGKGQYHLLPNGDIVQCRLTPLGLDITRWTTEEAR